MAQEYSAVIAAAGPAGRYGGIGQLKDKVGGKSVLCHSIDRFDEDDNCREIILVLSPEAREWVAGDPLTFASGKLAKVDGAGSRAASVAAGVRQASSELVVVQDGNRPNFSAGLLSAVLAVVKQDCGAAPGLPLGSGAAAFTPLDPAEAGKATEDFFGGARAEARIGNLAAFTAPGEFYAMQTPQAYHRDSYLAAVDRAGDALDGYLDDTALYLAAGYGVAVVAGHPGNIRVNTADDFNVLLKLMGGGQKKRKDKYGGLGW